MTNVRSLFNQIATSVLWEVRVGCVAGHALNQRFATSQDSRTCDLSLNARPMYPPIAYCVFLINSYPERNTIKYEQVYITAHQWTRLGRATPLAHPRSNPATKPLRQQPEAHPDRASGQPLSISKCAMQIREHTV